MKKIDLLMAMSKKEYSMSDLKELYYYLEVEFIRDCDNKTITMIQSQYITEVSN